MILCRVENAYRGDYLAHQQCALCLLYAHIALAKFLFCQAMQACALCRHAAGGGSGMGGGTLENHCLQRME